MKQTLKNEKVCNKAKAKKTEQIWEDKAKRAPIMESRGWKFQQAKLI